MASFVYLAGAQQQIGTPTFSSQAGDVDLSSLNVHQTIPIVNRAGRGLPFGFNLVYDSSFYTIITDFGSTPTRLFIPPAFDLFCLGCTLPPPAFGWGNSRGVAGITGIGPAGGFEFTFAVIASCFSGTRRRATLPAKSCCRSERRWTRERHWPSTCWHSAVVGHMRRFLWT
jgi:hypothetical protein